MRHAGLWLGIAFLALAGCSTALFRLQSEDEDKEREKARNPEGKTIGSVTSVWGAESVRLYGVGVVRGLEGTGGLSQPDEYRRMAIHDLKQRGVEDPAAFLSQPDAAVVLVSAVMPPGARKDDPLDIEVEVPPSHKTSSLRGGFLLECDLREYADAHTLRGNQGSHAAVKGKVLARAEGPIIVGLEGTGEKDKLRQGRILGGGRSLIDRNFALLLNREHQDAHTAKLVAERINQRFFGPFRNGMRGMAEAKNNVMITLKVPPPYRHNWPRYMRVLGQIPLRESGPGAGAAPRQLADQLLDPSLAVITALKLEAMSPEIATPILKHGLQNTHPLVRFASAEALAYLADPACGEPLAQLILQEDRFRAYGLTALASFDEAVCHLKLRQLLAAKNVETRVGAFRSLHTLDENDDALGETRVTGRFHVHRVAPDSMPLVHLSTVRRPEVVLFGEEQSLLPPFDLPAGSEFLVSAKEGEDTCIIGRFTPNQDPRREMCSLKLEEVIRKLAAMGAGYPDLVEFLLQASKRKNLDCALKIDALPRAASVKDLALGGARDKAATEQQPDTETTAGDLGMLPNLFAQPGKKPVRTAERGPGGQAGDR